MPESEKSLVPPSPQKPSSKLSFGKLLEWIGRYETSVLIVIIAMAAAVWLFIEIADEVREGDTLSFDEWAIRTLCEPENPSVPLGPKWLAVVGRDLTASAG